mgnify:CR=1 FL=1
MRLKSLEISGFKSFAKKSKLDFEAPITAIDVSSLTKLKLLGLGETSLTTVDISKLVNLEEVDFQQDNHGVLPYTTTSGTTVSGFTSLDFTSNTKEIAKFLIVNIFFLNCSTQLVRKFNIFQRLTVKLS